MKSKLKPPLKLQPCFFFISLWTFLGLNFLLSNCVHGQQAKGFQVVIKDKSGELMGIYKESHALLIGVSDYTAGWPDLESVPYELKDVAAILEDQGFRVKTLIDPDGVALEKAFENFIDQYGYEPDNRLFFFFSGHGHTRKKGTKGYLVPADAPNPDLNDKEFIKKALPMSQILAWSRQMESRHVLFLFDSCFSGTVFKARTSLKTPPHINRIAKLPVRQYITAGSAGETVPAKSVFTPVFVDALQYNLGDLNKDGYVSGVELGLYLQQKVPEHTAQTPQYGKISDYELSRGDFIFFIGSKLRAGLMVETVPPGGKIFLDGKHEGASPLTVVGLSPRRIAVRIEKQGYEPSEKTVRLRENKKTKVNFVLIRLKKYGSMMLISEPEGAEWYLDGDYMGTTPDEMKKLEKGIHRIELKKTGYKEWMKMISIHEKKRQIVRALLKPASPSKNRLYIYTEPENAYIWIPNIKQEYYLGMELEPDQYQVEISAPGYITTTYFADLRKGMDLRVQILLEKKNERRSHITLNNVQEKAIIITHNAKLFKNFTGDEGLQARFMSIYFLLKQKVNNRVPVSLSENKSGRPDGWLAEGSFVEWNTMQMLKMEPQSGRNLSKIFENQQCAELFGEDGQDPAGCVILGSEPNRIYKPYIEPQLLIPIFEKGINSYKAGFVQIFEKSEKEVPITPQKVEKKLGYDIVFAIDATQGMGKWFKPIASTLQTFMNHIEELVASDAARLPLRVGLLFYRDRLIRSECQEHFFLTEWGKKISDDIHGVIEVLQKTEESNCSSEDFNEAGLDGLNRVLINTKWEDNHFRAIILIGDAGFQNAHDLFKNPMGLDIPSILGKAKEKNVRFLSFKIGDNDIDFRDLALAADEQNKGRYKNISPHDGIEGFKATLLEAMTQEWDLLSKAQTIFSAGVDSNAFTNDMYRQKYDFSPYEALIIEAGLPSKANSSGSPEFVKGWIPEKIEKQLVVSEFIFMEKHRLKVLVNNLENIAEAALIGEIEGSDAFVEVIRIVLASQLKMSPSELFGPGITLNTILKKANILPFKTQVLSFTSDEVTQWKPRDFIKINKILSEKVNYLRELAGNPGSRHYFGNKPYFYVPRGFIP